MTIGPGPGEGKNPKDRNEFSLGPYRPDADMELGQIRQKAERAYAPDKAKVSESDAVDVFNNYWTPGYWYQPDHIGINYSNYVAHSSGYALPFTVFTTTGVDAIAIFIADGTASGVPNPGDYYRTKLGIYAESNGVPELLLAETPQFSYGDGSIPNNTLAVFDLNNTPTLTPGRYWVVFKRSSSANLGNPASPRFRSNGSPINGPFTQANIISTYPGAGSGGGIALAFTGSTGPGTDITMDPYLNYWSWFPLPAQFVPDIYLRAA
jgi:hypothetical protein